MRYLIDISIIFVSIYNIALKVTYYHKKNLPTLRACQYWVALAKAFLNLPLSSDLGSGTVNVEEDSRGGSSFGGNLQDKNIT